jgi:hypothetical protein
VGLLLETFHALPGPGRVDNKIDKLTFAALSFGDSGPARRPTTVIIQRYLDALLGDTAADPIVRELLDRSAGRLRLLCANHLRQSYPRQTRPPVDLETDELLGGVVAGPLAALRIMRPRPCGSSSPWPASTCAASSLTWPAA